MIFSLLFPPDFGGGATRAMNTARCLVNLGHEVRVITSVPHYPEGAPISKALRFYTENIEGMKVVRLPTIGLPHKGLFNRYMIYFWYAIFSFLALAICNGAEKVISFGPHPFVDVPSYLVKMATKSSLIVDMSDLWPETVNFEGHFINNLVQSIGCVLNRILLKHLCQSISVYNERALDFIVKHYDFKKRAVIVYNSVDTKSFVYDGRLKIRKESLTTICHKDIKDRFIVLYHGVIGPYQKLENVIKAAALEERNLGKALFVIVGEGEEKKKLLNLACSMHLKNTIILRKFDRDIVRKIVTESDLGLVPIVSRNPLTIYMAMPLKAVEFLAAGTPILVPRGSFIGSTVSAYFAGFEVDFGDPRNIYEAIRNSYLNFKRHEAMRERARRLAEERFSLDRIVTALRSIV